jgi:hypothetical protein
MVAALAGKIVGYDTQHVAGFWVVKLERQIFVKESTSYLRRTFKSFFHLSTQ